MPGGTDTVDLGSLAIQSALAETGVTAARQDPRFANLDGSGVTTVVIDTGIDLDHPFFGPDANGDGIDDRIMFQYDFADGDPNASDVAGHGSHVASLIGSQDSAYPGVAPGTDLIALKVFERFRHRLLQLSGEGPAVGHRQPGRLSHRGREYVPG